MMSSRRKKRKKETRTTSVIDPSEENNTEGEINTNVFDLPYDCLLHILSFHDTRSIIQCTGLVSKSLKDLWTRVTSLSFTNLLVSSDGVRKNGDTNFLYKPFTSLFVSSHLRNMNGFMKNNNGLMKKVDRKDSSEVRNMNRFMNFVDKVLELRRDDANVRSFHINSDYDCHSDRLISWISYAAMHGVEDLQVCIKTVYSEYIKLQIYVKLPECIFTCQTIKVLQLISCRRALLFPSPVTSTSIRLPQLQVLHLHGVICKYGNPVSAALADCPNLDTLIIRGCEFRNSHNLHISSLKLKKLSVTEQQNYVDIKIYAPNLTWLELVDVSSIQEHWLSKVLECSPLLQALVVEDVDPELGGEWILVAFASCPFLQTAVIRNCSTSYLSELHISSQYLEKFELRSALKGHPSTTFPISINAPNLTILDTGIRKNYSLHNVKAVVKAQIGIYPKNDPSQLEMKDDKRVMKVLNSLSNVKDLSILEPSSVLAITKQPKLWNLRSLQLHVWFYGLCILPLTYLLKSSPHIETLIMVKEEQIAKEGEEEEEAIEQEFERESEEEFEEIAEMSVHCPTREIGYYELEGMFNHIKTLEMINLKAVEDELEFLRAVLRNAPVLEKVIFTIAYRSIVSVKKRMKKTELSKFERASPDILFSFIHPRTLSECGKFNLKK